MITSLILSLSFSCLTFGENFTSDPLFEDLDECEQNYESSPFSPVSFEAQRKSHRLTANYVKIDLSVKMLLAANNHKVN